MFINKYAFIIQKLQLSRNRVYIFNTQKQRVLIWITGVKITYVRRSLMGFSIKFSGMKAAVLYRILLSLSHTHTSARVRMHTHFAIVHVSLVCVRTSQCVTNSDDKSLCLMLPGTHKLHKHTRLLVYVWVIFQLCNI